MGAEDSWKQSRCRLVGAEQSCRWSKGFVGADGDKELWEQSTSPGVGEEEYSLAAEESLEQMMVGASSS